MSQTNSNNPVPTFFLASAEDFKKVHGSPIAYWVSDRILNTFVESKIFEEYSTPKQGLATGLNDKFLRFWYETNYKKISFNCVSNNDSKMTG